MDQLEFEYFYGHLLECDPDYVVDVLGVTTKEILEAFPKEAARFIKEEHE